MKNYHMKKSKIRIYRLEIAIIFIVACIVYFKLQDLMKLDNKTLKIISIVVLQGFFILMLLIRDKMLLTKEIEITNESLDINPKSDFVEHKWSDIDKIELSKTQRYLWHRNIIGFKVDYVTEVGLKNKKVMKTSTYTISDFFKKEELIRDIKNICEEKEITFME